jgi:Flp pilus assembly pilin Flp
MTRSLHALWHDEAGFVASAELVLIATIGSLAMVVGLAEVSLPINMELQNVASDYGPANQTGLYNGLTGTVGLNNGNTIGDATDLCNGPQSIVNSSSTAVVFSN